MTVPGCANPLLMYGDAGVYQIERSLRFNSSDSASCARTPTSAGNRKTWTWAGWVKRSKLGTNQALIHCRVSANTDDTSIAFTDTDSLRVVTGVSNAVNTNAVFRDTSAWYHITCAFDTSQATAANRIKLYVNGVEQTFASTSYPSQNSDWSINSANAHNIGAYNVGVFYGDFYLAECYLIDGQALTPSSFTEVSATTGQLVPKAYTGSFTGNSFWLKFSDNSALTSGSNAGVGKDYSGLGNYWNTFGLSVTAGSGNDSLVDTPTSYGTDDGLGGSVRGNYCTLNPLDNSSGMTLANGNLDGSDFGGGHKGTRATIKFPASGKWYYEGTVTTLGGACCIGAATNAAANPDINATGSYYILVNSSGNVQRYQSFAIYTGFDTPTVGTILRVAYDADAQKLWLGLNGLWMNGSNGTTGNPATGANATFSSITDIYPAIDQQTSAVALNFGQRAFAYTAPTGFKALCDTNLAPPLVAKPNQHFDIITYPGNGSTQTIPNATSTPATALDFGGVGQIGFSWIKQRSDPSTSHAIYDARRGVQARLESDTVDQEATSDNGVTAFNAGTIALGSQAQANSSSETYVAWCWATADQDSSSHTQGSITSSVRANASAGFSIVTYTGNGTSGATVGHGLNIAPQLLIVKRRSSAGTTANWAVWHGSLAAGQNLFLNTTDSASAYSPSRFTSTLPTSSVFSVGGGDETNYSTGTFVCYAFAPVVGYSSFGSYTGNGSADGPFVYTGMRPRWVMVKCTQDIAGDVEQWVIKDTTRSTYNEAFDNLYANLPNAEDDATSSAIDMLSNGFKLRGTYGGINSSATYIYAAFAENPFQFSRAR